jgi:hypothetical protein
MIGRGAARGQALPLAAGLAALGAIALVMLFNGGQTVAARVRLTHAADATAYSAALVQARALNLLAYTNRAQIAHQVAMAHLVTLAAWAQFGQAEARQSQRRNPPATVIGMLFGAQFGAAYASAHSASSIQDALSSFGRAYARHDEIVHGVLASTAKEVIRSLPQSRQQAMQAVMRANYPEFGAPVVGPLAAPLHDRLGLAVLADDWPGFVGRYAGHTGGAFRPMVLRATGGYGFLDPRNRVAYNPWPVSSRCPAWRHELRRRGGTALDASGRWGATDTQSFHKLRSNKYIGCYYREYAMGWGKARARGAGRGEEQSVVQAPDDFSQQDFWRWVRAYTSWDIVSGMANPLAYAYALRGEVRWQGRGLPAYTEIPLKRSHEPARISLALRQPAALLSTTDARVGMAGPLGRFAYAGLQRHEAVTVASAAETYFERPSARRDGRTEIATLFRPYWQARLVTAPSVATLKGLP